MGEVTVITSGKGGVGKSTATANLGAALAAMNKKVIMLDTDAGLRNLDVVTGLQNNIVYNISDIFAGACTLRQATIEDKSHKNLYMLAASQTEDKTKSCESEMKKLCEELSALYDFVLIDCPAGIEQGFKNAVSGADRAIVVVTPDKASVRDADRVLGLLEERDMKNLYILINKMNPKLVEKGALLGTDEIIETLAADLLGVIPDDPKILINANCGKLVTGDKHARSAAAFENVAQRMLGISVPLTDLADDGSFRYKLRKKFSKKTPVSAGVKPFE